MNGCTTKKNKDLLGKNDTVIIDDQFTTSATNDKLWLNKNETGINPNFDVETFNLKDNFHRNTDTRLVTFGKAYTHPSASVYVKIANHTTVTQNLIIDVGHSRSDTITTYLLQKGDAKAIMLGKLYRNLPLKERIIPIRSFALPFSIRPNESAILLLQSKRLTGFHEIDVNLSTDKFFISKNNEDNFIRFSTFAITCFFVFAIFSLGFIFKHGILIRLGIYTTTLALALGQINFLYLADDLVLPVYFHLNGSTVGILVIFMQIALSILLR